MTKHSGISYVSIELVEGDEVPVGNADASTPSALEFQFVQSWIVSEGALFGRATVNWSAK